MVAKMNIVEAASTATVPRDVRSLLVEMARRVVELEKKVTSLDAELAEMHRQQREAAGGH